MKHIPSQIQQSNVMSHNPSQSLSERLKNLEGGLKNLEDIWEEDDLNTILLQARGNYKMPTQNLHFRVLGQCKGDKKEQ